jgi:hypothetical protein
MSSVWPKATNFEATLLSTSPTRPRRAIEFNDFERALREADEPTRVESVSEAERASDTAALDERSDAEVESADAAANIAELALLSPFGPDVVTPDTNLGGLSAGALAVSVPFIGAETTAALDAAAFAAQARQDLGADAPGVQGAADLEAEGLNAGSSASRGATDRSIFSPVVADVQSSVAAAEPTALRTPADAAGGVSLVLKDAPAAVSGQSNNALLRRNAAGASGSFGLLDALPPTDAPAIVSAATAMAAGSVSRSALSSSQSDPVVWSATAGSITGALSVPVAGAGTGTEFGGGTLGGQGGNMLGNPSGSFSQGSGGFAMGYGDRDASSTAGPGGLAAAVPNEASGSRGATRFAERANGVMEDSAVLGAASSLSRNAEMDLAGASGLAPGVEPSLSAQASVETTASTATTDPRAAWRDLRGRWDQPLRSSAVKSS